MSSDERNEALPSASRSKYSKFQEETRRLDELGEEYLNDDPLWESDDIRFTELYKIVDKLSKGISRWSIGAYQDREERINYHLGRLLNEYRKAGVKKSLFGFLSKSIPNAMLNDIRDSKPMGYRGSSIIPETASLDKWLDGGGIEDNEELAEYNNSADNDAALISTVSTMIRTISELCAKEKHKNLLEHCRLYLTRWLLIDTRSNDYNTPCFSHENELISQLDMCFIRFCMLYGSSKDYNTVLMICMDPFGKFHDMTKERPPFLSYCSYEEDEEITDTIENKVVSSYLYSVDRKGKDGGALSTNRITEIFKKAEKQLRISYLHEAVSHQEDKEIC